MKTRKNEEELEFERVEKVIANAELKSRTSKKRLRRSKAGVRRLRQTAFRPALIFPFAMASLAASVVSAGRNSAREVP